MKNSRNPSFRIIFVIAGIFYLLTFFIYKDLFRTFYQQDEWMALGSFFGYGFVGPLHDKMWMQMAYGSGRPFIWPFHAFAYSIFPFQIWPFAIFSLIGHPFIGILTCSIVFLLTGSTFGAIVAGLFFLVSYNGSQTVSWFATSTITIASTFFGLLSVVLLLKYVKNNKQIYMIASQISVICSFLFKESGFMFVLFLPFLYLIFYKGKNSIQSVLRIFAPLLAYFSFAVVMILIQLLKPMEQTDKFIGQSAGGLTKIIGNALYYPLLSLSQTFIPFPLVKKIDANLAEVSTRSDFVFIVLSIIFLCVFVISVYIFKKSRKALIISIAFVLCSFVPYAVLDRGASYLSSRYFYVGVIGASMLIGVYADILWNGIGKNRYWMRLPLFVMCMGLLFAYAYKNMQYIRRDVFLQVLDASERIMILREVKKAYPTLPRNPVFYITGDHPGYYYMESQKMPFQQGIGYTLMVWYYPERTFSQDILKEYGIYFWDTKAQGYRVLNGNGFGYYRDMDMLKKDLLVHKLFSKDQIVGFFYVSGDRRLVDISQKIRESLP